MTDGPTAPAGKDAVPAAHSDLAAAWLRDNADAIKAHDQRVAEHGVLITPIWLRGSENER